MVLTSIKQNGSNDREDLNLHLWNLSKEVSYFRAQVIKCLFKVVMEQAKKCKIWWDIPPLLIPMMTVSKPSPWAIERDLYYLFFSHLLLWCIAYQEATFARPPASYMMSASIDSATNIAYYFGGQPLEPLGASAVISLLVEFSGNRN